MTPKHTMSELEQQPMEQENEEEWEFVYNFDSRTLPQDRVFGKVANVNEDWKYYQTYGGGPEGGYIIEELEDSETFVRVYQVHREWGKGWTISVVYDLAEVIERRIEREGCRRRNEPAYAQYEIRFRVGSE